MDPIPIKGHHCFHTFSPGLIPKASSTRHFGIACTLKLATASATPNVNVLSPTITVFCHSSPHSTIYRRSDIACTHEINHVTLQSLCRINKARCWLPCYSKQIPTLQNKFKFLMLFKDNQNFHANHTMPESCLLLFVYYCSSSQKFVFVFVKNESVLLITQVCKCVTISLWYAKNMYKYDCCSVSNLLGNKY